MKKADISITTIIVAVIALIVMIVLIAIFSGKIAFFSRGVDSCTDKGGQCVPDCESGYQAPAGKRVGAFSQLKGLKDCKENICCIPIYLVDDN